MEQSKEKQVILIPANVVEQVVTYLSTKPFTEVAGLIQSMQINSVVVPEKELIDKQIIKLKTDANLKGETNETKSD